MSHSQPCLITIADMKASEATTPPPPSYQQASSVEKSEPREYASLKAKLISSQKMLAALQDENNTLKQQFEVMKKKTNRLSKLESAYQTIEREYENLITEKERQDSLERAARSQLERHITRYIAENDILHERIDELQRIQIEPQNDQIAKLNLILNEMIPQNKELQAVKERQKRDIEALEVTLKDQRNHIQILEKALSNAQEKVWRKEKEVEELSGAAERVIALQKAIEKSVVDKQKREEEWSRERAQLEMENAQLKMQLAKENVSVGIKKGAVTRSPDSEETVVKLKKTLHGKEDRIMSLEKQVIELETKFHEEMQRNKMAIATQSDTLSGKLKKMEEEKTEKDRKIAELTEEKEKLAQKLEEERRETNERVSILQREIDRIRSGDERRYRENMARMEQMRLKIADRRCLTADRSRSRYNMHGRSSSSSRVGATQNHVRTHSASALLSTDDPSPPESPINISDSGSPTKDSFFSSSYADNTMIRNIAESPSAALYKASLSARYSRPSSLPSYQATYRDSENTLLSRLPSRFNSPMTSKVEPQSHTSRTSSKGSVMTQSKEKENREESKSEEIWSV
ncbi:hypothetical protein AB6A40_002118 [Gnathostoma spinigerum]|uniref:Uncharacterized protein n=1 Tax=Gnathostoma spinigerum TaxID=75299 RepID=A0ABD6EDI9_9BILA